jgi:uncharacterized membrane protein
MKSAVRRIRTDFIAGIAVILPVVATIFIIRFLVITTNNAVLAPLSNLLEPYLRGFSLLLAKALIFVGVILFITLIGISTRLLLLTKVIGLGEQFLYRLPLINRIYRATKQISTAFLGEGKSMFKRVVLVQYPRPGLYSIGFMTTETKGNIDKNTGVATISVFIPTTPNPTSGMLVMVPKEDITYLDMSVEDGMKLVVSGGVVTP